MFKKMFILVLFSSLLSGCSLGTAKVYRVQSNADLLSAKTSRKLDKQEPLETVEYPWRGKAFIDFRKYCNGRPAEAWSFYQKTAIWGFSSDIIIKFKCEN